MRRAHQTDRVPAGRLTRHSETGVTKRNEVGAEMVKLLIRDRETIQEAVRRFRKLVDRIGLKKEMRRKEFYEKPSETSRRAKIRAERRNKRTNALTR